LKIDSTFYNGKKISVTAIGDTTKADYHFEIIPPKTDLKDTAKVKIFYQGKMGNEGKSVPWGGVHYEDSLLYSMGVGFLNNYVGTTQHWLACYDHPSDKATLKARFIVPTGNFVAAGGTFNVSYPDNGTDIFDYFINYPTATYLLTFNIGKLEEMKFAGAKVPIFVYCDHQDTIAAKYAFKLVPDMVNYFEKTFGPYPFFKVGYVTTKKGSMESQEMINFYKSLMWSAYSKKDSTNLTAAHELSHMWFGNSVSPLDFREAWLNESWATFSECLWMGNLGGMPNYLNELDKKMNLYYNNIVKLEGTIPLYDYPRNSATSNYPTTIYYKGALVVGMLRHKLGDSAFFHGVREYLAKYKYSNLNTDNLKVFFEGISGQNLDKFFNQWIYSPGWPKLKATIIYNEISNSEYLAEKLKIEQVKSDGWGYDKAGYFLDFPIEVTFKRKDGTSKDTLLWINGDIKEITLNKEPVYSLQLNKGRQLRTLIQTLSVNYEKAAYIEENASNLARSFVHENVLTLNFLQPNEYKVRIFDMLGNEVINRNSANSSDLQIDMNHLSRGLYQIIVLQGDQIAYKNKIILN
jgi:aminopeptidase N